MTPHPTILREPSQSRHPHFRGVLLAFLLAACGPSAEPAADASAPDAGTDQSVDAAIADADDRPSLATDAEYLDQQPDAD